MAAPNPNIPSMATPEIPGLVLKDNFGGWLTQASHNVDIVTRRTLQRINSHNPIFTNTGLLTYTEGDPRRLDDPQTLGEIMGEADKFIATQVEQQGENGKQRLNAMVVDPSGGLSAANLPRVAGLIGSEGMLEHQNLTTIPQEQRAQLLTTLLAYDVAVNRLTTSQDIAATIRGLEELGENRSLVDEKTLEVFNTLNSAATTEENRQRVTNIINPMFAPAWYSMVAQGIVKYDSKEGLEQFSKRMVGDYLLSSSAMLDLMVSAYRRGDRDVLLSTKSEFRRQALEINPDSVFDNHRDLVADNPSTEVHRGMQRIQFNDASFDSNRMLLGLLMQSPPTTAESGLHGQMRRGNRVVFPYMHMPSKDKGPHVSMLGIPERQAYRVAKMLEEQVLGGELKGYYS